MKNITKTKPKILIVDDDNRILDLLKQFFVKNGFECSSALNANEAEKEISKNNFDLVILDVMLPGITGFEFAERLKSKARKIPIMLLTALSEPDNRVKGLESGADDYITKPFDPRELLLRANNLIDLYQNNTKEFISHISWGNCKYDFITKNFTKAGEDILLTSQEQKLLEFFIDNKSRPISREEIINFMGVVSDRSIDVQIVRLRNKIELDAKQPKYLKTVRYQGYGLFI